MTESYDPVTVVRSAVRSFDNVVMPSPLSTTPAPSTLGNRNGGGKLDKVVWMETWRFCMMRQRNVRYCIGRIGAHLKSKLQRHGGRERYARENWDETKGSRERAFKPRGWWLSGVWQHGGGSEPHRRESEKSTQHSVQSRGAVAVGSRLCLVSFTCRKLAAKH